MKKINLLLIGLLVLPFITGCDAKNKANVLNSTPIFTYNVNEIPPSSVEEIVENTYDSVVSIKADYNQYSYSSGSGTFISYDEELNLSYILTCYHVIDDASSYTVTLSDQKTTLIASLVGGDPTNDIALLSVSGTNYKYATIPETSSLKLGSQVVVIGNPLGTLPGSVTSGYVSFLNREVLSEDYRTMKLIQTDASINSGNSGGAMFDSLGRLVGVVNAKYVDEGVEGLGFAIPIEKAMDVVTSVLKTAQYDGTNWTTKGYYEGSFEFAFTVSDFSSFFSSSYVAVSAISDNSSTSGYNQFNLYDEIRSVSYNKIDGTNGDVLFTNSQTLMQQLYKFNLSIGDTVTFKIIRNRVEQDIVVTISQFIPN